jgi:rubredoxin
MQCRICGYIFDETKKSKTCNECSTHNCKLARCPNCGYENLSEVKDYKSMDFLKKLLKNKIKIIKN